MRGGKMSKLRLAKVVVISGVCMLMFAVVLGVGLSAAFGSATETTTEPAGPAGTPPASGSTGWVALAIAISVASGALGAGYAVGKVGSAALGAASERPEIIGRALVFVVIAEGIAVWGLVGAILLIGKL
jgi:V/A-type H+/Na+-transporting ATPase subunit K